MHQPIDRAQVAQVELWGGGLKGYKTTGPEEATKIIDWFNSATDPRENKELARTTPEAGIRIRLKSGEEVRIVRSGQDFEVARETQMGKKQYWLKQPDMRKLLDSLAKPASP